MQLASIIIAQDPAPKTQGSPGDFLTLPMLALILGAVWFILILPMKRKEKREREGLLAGMKKNDEVLTASGIIGIVALVKDDEVVLKVDESSNTRLRVRKNSIVQILTPRDGSGKPGADVKAVDTPAAAGQPPAN